MVLRHKPANKGPTGGIMVHHRKSFPGVGIRKEGLAILREAAPCQILSSSSKTSSAAYTILQTQLDGLTHLSYLQPFPLCSLFISMLSFLKELEAGLHTPSQRTGRGCHTVS
jgi:hypothetical protein